MEGPLDGITVLEVANWLAGPATAALLADLGADVLKVEAPQGDTWRAYRSVGPLAGQVRLNPAFQQDNRGKRSIALNLGHPEGRALVQRLARGVDIFLTNLIPRRLERYGLTYAALSAENRRLIYASLNAFGPDGPDRDRLGFDYTAFWARSGIMDLVGDRDAPPAMPRAGMGDHATSLALAWAIMTALYVRLRTGEGQAVQASLLATGLWVLGSDLQTALLAGEVAPKHARVAPRNPLQNTYRARDGRWLLLNMPQADRDWPRVCAALGLEELEGDARFSSLQARAQHGAELALAIERAIAGRTRGEWAAILDRHDLIWEPVQEVAEVIADPQVRANGYLAAVEGPDGARFETIAAPVRFGRSRAEPRSPAPELGQHTEAVLLALGLSWEEIQGLRERGAIG